MVVLTPEGKFGRFWPENPQLIMLPPMVMSVSLVVIRSRFSMLPVMSSVTGSVLMNEGGLALWSVPVNDEALTH